MREGGETRERAYRFLVLAKKMKVEGSTAYGKRTAFDLEAGLACSQTLRTFGGGRGTREDPCTRPASGEKEREREREREARLLPLDVLLLGSMGERPLLDSDEAGV